MFYDSFEETKKIIGKVPVETENWRAYQNFLKRKSEPSSTITNSFSSHGLLKNNITLYHYQEEIFRKMLSAKRGICSMVMGSGKTLTTIACFAYLKAQNPNIKMLVISPKSLCSQWISEIKRATESDTIFIKTPEQIKAISTNKGPFVATYQYVTKHIDEFKKNYYDIIVVDEAQFVKNNDTKIWKALSQIKSEYFFGLSGTVIENRLDDFYSIMEIVSPGKLGPKWKFNHLFQEVLIKSPTKIVYTGVKNLDLLKSKVQDNVFFYDQILLPPITHNYIYVKCEETEKNIHDEYYQKAKILISKSLNNTLSHVEKILLQSYLLKARQAANSKELITKKQEPNSNKIKEFLSLVGSIILNKEKIVVFSEWTEYLSIAKRETDKLGIGSVVYTGEQNIIQRNKALKDFQNDPNISIFFSSDAGGVGLDGLQIVANNVLHLELPWNPSKLDQRTGRVYRLLQTKPVNVYYLVSNDTIEMTIENLLKTKRDTRNQTLKKFI